MLPRCFTKRKDVVELVQGITSQGALADVIDPTAEEPVPLTAFEPAEDRRGSIVAARAAGAHLPGDDCATARRSARSWPPRRSGGTSSPPSLRAFLGDGGPWIWIDSPGILPDV